MLGRASPACTVMFNHGARDLKPVRFTFRVIMGVTFFDIVTFFTNEKFGQMRSMVMVTCDKGVK